MTTTLTRSAAAVRSMRPADAPARSLLDGRRFDGIVLEPGKTIGDPETLIFAAGRFRSTACDRYGYGYGAYTATFARGEIVFLAQTESPKYGKLRWRGTVRGSRLDGSLTMVREGVAVGEKWILAGEC
jgi:hypothetical protein